MRPIWVWTRAPGWFSAESFPEVHRLYEVRHIGGEEGWPSHPAVLLVDADLLQKDPSATIKIDRFARDPSGVFAPVIALADGAGSLDGDELVFDVLPAQPSEGALLRTLRNAAHYLESQLRLQESQAKAEQKARELEELHAIGIALSAEHDHNRLLNLILSKAREITNADAGSLFLVAKLDMPIETPEGAVARVGGRWLRFRVAQNDSRQLRFEEDILAIGPDSIAGYVAQTGETLNLEDAYSPPKDKPFAINRSFDEAIRYRTRSVLVIPMQNHEGESIGVLQLINKKRSRDVLLTDPESFDEQVLPFDEHDVRLVRSLASQAAVSVENNSLYLQRENLFARFVDSAVRAIERRDITTQGHSRRVAAMTTELARVVNRATRGTYADLTLSSEQVRELRYAALLHDFGKVGVKERVLLKGKKLYHRQLAEVQQRFKTIHRTIEAQYFRRMVELVRNNASPEEIERLKVDLARRLEVVEQARQEVENKNLPTVTHESKFERLFEFGSLSYEDLDGTMRPYLEPEELAALTVPRGTLTDEERDLMQKHVTYSYDFLCTIPWTRDLLDVPELARSHHEKLDGTGYPGGLLAERIPPQTRMMTISDIYDALTAADRPYKPAVTTRVALEILERDADRGRLDRDLLDLFIEAKVYTHGLTN